MKRAFAEYIAEVKANTFPGAEQTVEMSDEEWQCLEAKLTSEQPSFVVSNPAIR